MTPSDRAAAQAALSEGRTIYSRLDQIRGPEDAAADIMDLWGAAESAMRAMLGGSTLSGQPLVRELRQRGSLNLEQANAIASFWDARSRVDDVGYKPTLTDVGYARVGYNELTRAINDTAGATEAPRATTDSPYAPQAGGAAASTIVPPATAAGAAGAATAGSAAASATTTPTTGATVHHRRRSVDPVWVIVGVVLLAAIAGGLFFAFRSPSYDKQLADGVALMQTNRVESARAAFTKIAHDHPDKSTPHVFLARLARTDGDLPTAQAELTTAIRLNNGDEKALREMGILLLSQKDYDLARKFLIRAVKADTTDAAAQGYLGCALVGLNRPAEGQTFLSKAGAGSWSTCATAAIPGATPLKP